MAANKQVDIKKLLRSDDAFLSTWERFQNYFLSHTRQFVLAALVLVLAVVAIVVVVNVRGSNQAKAAEAAQAAIAVLGQDPARAIPDLTAVIEQYPGSPSAQAATLALAQAQISTKNYAQAVEILEKFSESLPPGEERLKNLTLISLGQLYEELNNLDLASRNYRAAQALTKGADSLDSASGPIQSELTLSVGRILEATGKIEEAKRVYEAFRLTYPNRNSFQDVLAQYRLVTLTVPTVPADHSSATVPVDQSSANVAADQNPVNASDDKALSDDVADAKDAALDNATNVQASDNKPSVDQPKPKPKSNKPKGKTNSKGQRSAK
ncbi:MAG: tetratricopeptide repeat protein [Deltaproteobacteria bacterium]|nr:tetratricopeptide repeat protein [Deltaproteobacteria bacterium]